MAPSISALDSDSYEPLASIAYEIGRELGGDGLLVTWHGESVGPRYFFADGLCKTNAEAARGVAEIGESAAKVQHGGARSQWRMLADSPASGVLTTSIPAERGVLTIAALFKRVGRSTRMTAGETAARLLPFIQPFFRAWLSRLRTVATVRALTAVVNNSDIGVLLLDRSGQIILANSSAEERLARGDGLRRKNEMVVGENLTDTLQLHAAIEGALKPGAAGQGASGPHMVGLRRRDAPPLMAAVVANPENRSDGADFSAIVYIIDPDQDLHRLVEPVCRFYRLSPAETRLACTLVGGQTLAHAAEQLNLREQTARTYLKQIFLKTDTNRQAELVRLLLISAVRAGHAVSSATDPP